MSINRELSVCYEYASQELEDELSMAIFTILETNRVLWSGCVCFNPYKEQED